MPPRPLIAGKRHYVLGCSFIRPSVVRRSPFIKTYGLPISPDAIPLYLVHVIYCRLKCGQRESSCARHITVDWIGLDWCIGISMTLQIFNRCVGIAGKVFKVRANATTCNSYMAYTIQRACYYPTDAAFLKRTRALRKKRLQIVTAVTVYGKIYGEIHFRVDITYGCGGSWTKPRRTRRNIKLYSGHVSSHFPPAIPTSLPAVDPIPYRAICHSQVRPPSLLCGCVGDIRDAVIVTEREWLSTV